MCLHLVIKEFPPLVVYSYEFMNELYHSYCKFLCVCKYQVPPTKIRHDFGGTRLLSTEKVVSSHGHILLY